MQRRAFLIATTAASLAGLRPGAANPLAEGPFEITRTEAEWRSLLSGPEYAVLREADTEAPYSSPLNDEDRAGTYLCGGCQLPVYSSETKYDSGTGWPSFTEALPNAIGTAEDRSFIFQVRTECHCRRCGSHLGHIFEDGPAPTGMRHCLNGLALDFSAA